MNRKGFTLIELLAVIVIIGILGVLIVPGILKNINTAKESSYNTLIKNIVTSSQMYYEECEYGDLSNEDKYQDYACSITNNTITIRLGTLANTGFLNVKDTKKITVDNKDKEIRIVKDPKNDKDISDCTIKITKEVNSSTYKVTYKIENTSTDDICPQKYE